MKAELPPRAEPVAGTSLVSAAGMAPPTRAQTGIAAAHQVHRRRAAARLASYTVALLALLAYILPLLYLVNSSLKTQPDFLRAANSLTTHPHPYNFVTAWREAAFSTLVGNSLLYTLVSASAGTLLSLFLAFPIARGYVRFQGLWYRLFLVSLFLPLAITTQFQLLLDINIEGTRLGYILLMTANFGVGPFLMTNYLKSVPRELDEAAAVDGMGYFRYVLRIVAPIAKPVIITAFIFQAIGVWNDIINATIYLNSPNLQPITRGLLTFSGQYSSDVPLLSAAILTAALPLLALYILAQRYFVPGALSGSFKG
jgi:raffinose/stachyose/melibiose transport system permease protein